MEGIEFFDPNGDGGKNQDFRATSTVPGHLDTPIYYDEVDMLLTGRKDDFKCRRHRFLWNKIQELGGVRALRESVDDEVSLLYEFLQDQVIYQPSEAKRELTTILCSSENLIVHKINMLSPLLEGKSLKLEALITHTSIIIDLLKQNGQKLLGPYLKLIKSEIIKDTICYKDIELGKLVSYGDILVERDISFIKKCRWYMLPTSLLISVLDMLQTDFPMRLNWIIADIMVKYPGKSISRSGDKLIEKFKYLRSKLGGDFHGFVSDWEAMIIGWIVAMEDDIGFTDLYNLQREELTAVLERHRVFFNLNDILPQDTSIHEVLMRLELIGVMKSFGFPILQVTHLLDKIKEHGTRQNVPLNPKIISDTNAIARRDFCLNYYKKKRVYPNFYKVPPELQKFLYHNRWVPAEYFKRYDLWADIIFCKTLKYDYTPDMTEILKDSSVAVPEKYFLTKYDVCAFRYHYNREPPSGCRIRCPFPTRAVLAYLQSNPEDVKKYINERISGNPICEEDHKMEVCGKEKELTPLSGRGFIKNTWKQRLIQTSMEYNTSKGIFPFVPEQAMTSSEIIKTRREQHNARDLTESSEVFTLDLTKWCLFWRHPVTIEIGRMYDELFGLEGLFANGHKVFIGANLYCNSRLHPPEIDHRNKPIPGPFFMNNLIGGLEGMRQKIWTHFTISAIKLAAESVGLRIDIMGQGDNQVVIMHYERDVNRGPIREQFIDTLDQTLRGIGHLLKRRETWVSKKFHEFGKQRTYLRITSSTSTKKACRLTPDSNDLLNSIPSCMANINTLTEGMARDDQLPDCAFMVNQIMMTRFLIRRGLGSRNSKELNKALLFFPIDFGGLPLSTYQSHAIRGHTDSVTLWLSLIKTLQNTDRVLFERVMQLWVTKPREGDDKTRLLEDYFALNIASLPSADMTLKDAVLRQLKDPTVTKNPILRKLMRTDVNVAKSQLAKTLFSMKPYYPSLGHEIYRNSNVGLVEKIPGRFTSVSTLCRIAKAEEHVTIIELIAKKNKQLIDCVRDLIRRRSKTKYYDSIVKTNCVTRLSEKIRKEHWGLDFIGLTRPPMSHMLAIYNIDDAIGDIEPCIVIQTSREIRTDPKMATVIPGPYTPYVGSVTGESIKKPSSEFSEKTSFTRALMNLGKLKSWVSKMNWPMMIGLLDNLISEKREYISAEDQDVPLEDVFEEVTSGNIFHRLLTQMDKPYAMFNMLVGPSSHFIQSSNLMRTLTSHGEDYNLFYQLIYITNMVNLVLMGCITDSLAPTYISRIRCINCLTDLSEVKLNMTKISIPKVAIPNEVNITRNISPEDAFEMTEYVIGIILAGKVEKDFEKNHDWRQDILDKIQDSVSVNDLRQLRLSYVIMHMITNSRHCREIVKNPSMLSVEQGQDLSFTTLAQVAIDTGIVSDLIRVLGTSVTEHTMVTQANKLSTHISRSITSFTLKNKNLFRKAALKYINRPMKDLEPILSFLSWIVLNENNHVLRLIRRGQYNIAVPKISSWTPRMIELTPGEVIGLWRKDRAVIYPDNDEKTFYANRISNFPSPTEFLSYHISRQEVGDIRIKEIAYIPRVIGCISSAASKYVEVLLHIGIESISPIIDNIYSLAEGSGGLSAILSVLFPNANMFYNTLMEYNIDPRDDPTEWRPPAVLALGLMDRYPPSRLSSGTTDILDFRFQIKLEESFKSYKPSLLTMDAESKSEASNMEFLSVLLPLIERWKIPVVILKLFDFNFKKETHLISSHEIYYIKPICSNPIGREFFLLLVIKELPQPKHLILQEPYSHKYVSRSHGMTMDSLKRYFNLSGQLVQVFLNMFVDKELQVPSRYDDFLSRMSCCGLICRKFLLYMLDTIESIHRGKCSDLFKIAVRRSGTNEALRRLLYSLVFVVITLQAPVQQKPVSLLQIKKLTINKELEKARKGIVPVVKIGYEGKFFEEWGDSKFYLRSFARFHRCRCRFELPLMCHQQQFSPLGLLAINDLSVIGVIQPAKLYKHLFNWSTREQYWAGVGSGKTSLRFKNKKALEDWVKSFDY